MDQSKQLRENGNDIYRTITDDLSPVVRRSRLEQCLTFYNKALAIAYNIDDKISASKNIGMASYKMMLFLEDQNENEKLVMYFFLECLRHFSAALEIGDEQSMEWKQHLNQKVYDSIEHWMQSVHQLTLKDRVGTLERVIEKIPACAKTTVNLELADSLFKSAVVQQENGNYKECLRCVHECYRPLEVAKQYCHDCGQQTEIDILEEDVFIQMSVAEAKKAIKTGDELMDFVLLDEESLNIEMVWEIIDWFQQAIILARQKEVEIEAIACSRIGYVYDRVLKLKSRAKEPFMQCIHLAFSLEPKNVTMEDWFKLATETLQRYQQEYQRVEDAKWENKCKKYKEELKQELIDLNEIFQEERLKKNPGKKRLLEKIYKRFPPKNPKFTMSTIDLNDESGDSVKKAFQKAVTHYHPDRQKEEYGEKWKCLSEEVCKILTACYEELRYLCKDLSAASGSPPSN